jgi:carboxyl-terminal processing protease
MEPEKLAPITISLISKSLISDYATEYRAKHEKIGSARNFELNDYDYLEFVNWVSKKEYDYTTKSEKILADLKASAEKEKYYENIKDDYEAMSKTMMHDKKRDLEKEKNQIKSMLEEEIVSRYYLNTGRTEASFKSDTELKKAVEVLNDEKRWKDILKR